VAISNGYATLNEVKAALRISDAIDDTILELSIEAASREIDGYCERRFYQTTGTAVYIPQDSFTCEIDDLVTLTSLKSSPDGTGYTQTWTASDYQFEPLNNLSGGIPSPYTRIRAVGDYTFPVWEPNNVNAYEATVQVVGTFGWASVPAAMIQATILLSLRHYRRYESHMGVAGFDDVSVIRVGRVDPDVQRLIDPFRKVRMA
jgi:hypothetical protein